MAITMAAVQQGYLMVMQKNVVAKLASKYFKQQRSKYFKQQRVTLDNTSFWLSPKYHKIKKCPYVVICNCDHTTSVISNSVTMFVSEC